jgi:hypothetical protein
VRVFWEHARPTPQALTTPTNPLGFQELWHFDLDGLEEDRESLLIADVDGDGAEELLLNTADRNRLQVLQDGRVVAHDSIPATWKRLVAWREQSAYRPANHQWLEEHIHVSDVENAFDLDLYLPIAES